MTERIVLVGSEDVIRGGQIMQNAANDMKQAVSSLEAILDTHRRFMDDWLRQFEQIVTELNHDRL